MFQSIYNSNVLLIIFLNRYAFRRIFLFPFVSIISPNNNFFTIHLFIQFILDLTMYQENFNLQHNSSNQPTSLWSKSFHSNTSLLFSFVLFFAYAIIFLVGLIANIFVIVVIIKCRRMRTLTNRFLLNLAISDLLATLICLPPTAYHHYDKRWIFGEFLCRFVPFIQGIYLFCINRRRRETRMIYSKKKKKRMHRSAYK